MAEIYKEGRGGKTHNIMNANTRNLPTSLYHSLASNLELIRADFV